MFLLLTLVKIAKSYIPVYPFNMLSLMLFSRSLLQCEMILYVI